VTSVVVQFTDGTQQKLDAAAAAPATQPGATPQALPGAGGADDWSRPILGVNLESLRDYERQFMFIDAMKTSRKFGSPEKPYDAKAAVDADGWPTGDAGTMVMTEVKNVNGTYLFSATGRCTLSCPGSPAKVVGLSYDPVHNRTTASVVVQAPRDKVITVALAFRNTAGGLKDIKLLRPGYTSDQQVFTSDFLNAVKPFDAIRFMDYLRTNNSTIQTWDQRPKVTDAQYTINGGPYEYAIDLGNVLNKDIWINVPALADDDFVRRLGALVRARLKPNLHCYVEYSNEVWNGIFKQFKQNLDLAKAEVAAGDATLNDGGKDTNQFYWARKRVAKRSVEIKKLMGADDPRIRMILPSQVSTAPPGAMLKRQLEYVAKYFGPPSQFFFAVAQAPYFSTGRDENDPARKKWFTERTDLTVDAICERLLKRTDASCTPFAQAFHQLAHEYGLKSFAYEGGLDLQQFDKQVNLKIASQYDLRTGQAVEQYLNNWYDHGGDALFYFTLSCKYSKSGYWGLTEDVRELLTPKYLAALRVENRLRGWTGPATAEKSARAPGPSAPGPSATAK
jgi:hypothetical protein